jgi:hypothetical protein
LVIKNPGTCHYDAMALRFACLFGLASVAIVTSARPAHALGPVDVEVGAKAGVGAEYSGAFLNPLGFGLGARAGVVLFDHLYSGINVMYYFGASETSESVHTLMYGVEAGWGFKPLDNVIIRPQVGLGNASFSYASLSAPQGSAFYGATTSPTTDAARNQLYVEPGVTVLVALGMLFVGADANVLVFPGLEFGDVNSGFFITLHGQVGVKF